MTDYTAEVGKAVAHSGVGRAKVGQGTADVVRSQKRVAGVGRRWRCGGVRAGLATVGEELADVAKR